MKSMSRGGIAGNAKLRGKREVTLSCRCCNLINLKVDYNVSQQKKEIEDFKRGHNEYNASVV
jgi:hypothetical protein